MKTYKKTYENVYSTDKHKQGRLDLSKVLAEGMSIDEYTPLFKNFLNDFYINLFDGFVRFSWLRRKFRYRGLKIIFPLKKTPSGLSLGFFKFMIRVVGKSDYLITKGQLFYTIEPHLNVLFPGFEEGNPFENPEYYKFPFKNVSMDYLIFVHQVDDCIPLLQMADELKMSYAVFIDYVINHVLSINEELGRDRYQFNPDKNRRSPFFIIDSERPKMKRTTKLKK